MPLSAHSRVDSLRHDVRNAATFGQRVRALFAYLVACIEVSRQRRALRHLDTHMLHDIGISPADANQEIARSFWDIPKQADRR